MLQKLYDEYGNKRLEVVGIFIQEDARAMDLIKNYTKEHHVTFPVVLGDRTVAINYLGLSPSRPNYHVPVFYFVSPDGQILEERDPDRLGNQEWFGSMEANLESTIRRLMPPEPARKGGKRASKPDGAAKKPAGKKTAAKSAARQ